jgi:hypothetical protein
MHYIYEEDNHLALVRLGRQGAFKSTTVYYVRAGKGLMKELSLAACALHPDVRNDTTGLCHSRQGGLIHI